MSTKFAVQLGAVAVVVGVSALPVVAQTVNDHGFEETVVNDSFIYNPSGAFVGTSGVTDPPSGFSNVAAPEGEQYAFLQQGNGTVGAGGSYINRNVFGLVEGQQYTVTFAAAGRGGAGPNTVSVIVNNAVIGTTVPTNDVFADFTTGPFTAGNTVPGDLFLVGGSAGVGGDLTSFVDNIRVNLIPEPTAAAILIAGGAVPLFARRRQSRRN